MGCGRSRHSSPSSPDKYNSNDKQQSQRAKNKRQRLSSSCSNGKSGNKRDASTPTSSTNGSKMVVKSDWQTVEVKTEKKEGPVLPDWQLEEAVDPPSETVLAVYKSSVPYVTPINATHNSNTNSTNGSLVNGSHPRHRGVQDITMQVEVPDKVPSKEKLANSKAVHITNSQVEFFRMLDEKIDQGPDYFSEEEEDGHS